MLSLRAWRTVRLVRRTRSRLTAQVYSHTLFTFTFVFTTNTHDLRNRYLVDRADDGVEVTGASALVVAPIWLNAAVLFVDQYVHHTTVCLLANHVSDHMLIPFVCCQHARPYVRPCVRPYNDRVCLLAACYTMCPIMC
jgi:hypothetical protein